MKNNENKGYVVRLTLIATLGGLLFGYDTAVISGAVASLRHYFIDPMGLQAYEANAMEGFVIGSALIGCIIGAAIAGLISQRFGRKKALFAAASLFLIAAIGTAWPEIGYSFPSTVEGHRFIWHFVAYRILGGIGVGVASMVSPMYIAEIAPPEKRGKLVSFNQFAIIFGMLVVYFVNYAIANQGSEEWLYTMGWRWMFASLVIPAGLFFLLLFFAPETPRWLVMRGYTEKAKNVLRLLVGEERGNDELANIKNSFANETEASLKPYFRFMLAWIILLVAFIFVFKLFDLPSAFEIALVVSFYIALVVPIKSFGFKLIMSGVLLSAFQQLVGIQVVLYYTPEIFKSMGAGTDTALLQTIIVGAINLTFTVIAIMSVDKFGRRPLLIVGGLVMGISMLGLGTAFDQGTSGGLKLVFMLTYTAGFAMSWGPVCWVMLSEIFPNAVRSSVMAIAVAAQWVTNFLSSWIFPILDKNEYLVSEYNHGFAYWIYGIMGLLAALFVWKGLPETKGKSLEDMETMWKNK